MRWVSREKSCDNARGADAGEWAASAPPPATQATRKKAASTNLVVSSCNAKRWDNQSELTMVSASPRNTPKFDKHRGGDLSSRYCSSLHVYAHNRRFMSQARRTQYFAWSAKWGEEKKNKALFFLFPSIRDSYSSRASECCVHLASLVKRLLCRLALSQVAQARNMGIDLVA